MDNKLTKLLKEIKLDEEYLKYFENAQIKRVEVYDNNKLWLFVIETGNNINVATYNDLYIKLKNHFHKITTIDLIITPRNIDASLLEEHYNDIIVSYCIKNKSLCSLNDKKIHIQNDNLQISAYNKIEYANIKKISNDLKHDLRRRGYNINDININIEDDKELNSLIEKEKNITTVANISNTYTPPKQATKDEEKPKYRPKKDNTITKIDDILYEVDNLTIEGMIFGIDLFEAKSGYKIFTLKVTDFENSIYVKLFTKDDEECSKIKDYLKEKSWYHFYGKVNMDKYANELTFVTRYKDIEKIDSPINEEIKDEEEIKRVELHAHTMMSQMDGITGIDLGKHTCELVSKCIKMGYRGVAITDHNGCQAFPIAYGIINDYNKKQEDITKHFKGLYGTELTLVDDTVDIVIRPTNQSLENTTYVVFDTETTGFNAGGKDVMIEIGAVKILNGEICDRFDELIDPKMPLPSKITELTCITDEMLKGKDDEETVTKRFLEWVGDLPMVAHNAKFDISFIEMAMKKYNLGKFKNTVIDTLELSRALDQGYSRHSLSALVKRYNVYFDEDAHHRADYDAEGTAKVFHKMLSKLITQNYNTIADLEKLVSKDEIHKFGRTYHFNAIAKNKQGLKNLFKIISLANTVYLYKTPRILRSKLNELREGLLIGSGCYESEVFIEARSKEKEELTNIINFYDYVEVQPPEVYDHLIQTSDFSNNEELKNHIKKIINATKESGKLIVATGDVHHFRKEDKIYREIIINQKIPGGGRHPLNKSNIKNIPSQHFRTTKEMLENFSFLDKELAYEIVVTNTNKVLDMVDEVEVIIDTGGIPFSPRVKSDDGKSYLDCPRVVTDLVYDKAKSWYGDNLPYNIEERIAKELYGDIVYKCYEEMFKKENLSPEELSNKIFTNIHKTIIEGFPSVKKLISDYIKNNWIQEEDGPIDETKIENKVKKNLGGIIGGGFDPIYLIAQRLVKHSNDEGYLVGSRGSVGSSFVATLMGITEVNPLPAHYRCLNCKHSIFKDEKNTDLGATYSSGFDLPDKNCPICGSPMYKDGQDMPFATFLGFNADKVPDIDLNFSDLNQASAHEYTKVLFGVDNVYRAGTIGTVADKTAFGFVRGYFEDRGITNKRMCEIERLAMGCTGVKRTTGQHPGGIVVVPDYMEVSDFTPYQFPAEDPTSPWRTTHFDYHAIDQDLLKLDILGHSDPTQLRMIQDLTKTDIQKVPLDDKATMSIFTSTKALGVTEEQILCKTGTLGIPEFGTPFTIGMVEETKPKTFAELIKISGLSHGTDVWLGNARDLIINNVVPFKEVIGCRDDIMVYLMYHGVEPIKAFKIMEFVRKGKASKDKETWEKHRQTMVQAGIEPWFIDSCAKIKYMFPKAHAAAYVISAFRIAWYKVHMPAYYYASWFTTKATDFDIESMIKGYDKIKEAMIAIENKGYDATNKENGILESLKLALEMTARGIKVAKFDLYKSKGLLFDVEDDNTIIPPFRTIDGLGDVVAKNIEREAKIAKFVSIEDFQNRCKVSQTLIDKMRTMGIFEGMPETSQLSLF